MDQSANVYAIKFLFHPVLVHFPIAFYFLELFLLVLWVLKDDAGYRRFSYFSFKIGYFSMLAAMAAGIRDAGGFGNIRGLVQRHFIAALIVFTIYTLRALFYWRAGKSGRDFRWVKIAGALLGVLAIAYAGYLGGLLVYS